MANFLYPKSETTYILFVIYCFFGKPYMISLCSKYPTL